MLGLETEPRSERLTLAGYSVFFGELYADLIVRRETVLLDLQRDLSGLDVSSIVQQLPLDVKAWPTAMGARPGAAPTAPWEEELDLLLPKLQWRAARSWRFAAGRHINVYELRAWTRLMRDLSKRTSQHNQRVVSMWDSRVCQSVVAKGRSRSRQLLSELRRTLPHILGAGLEYTGFWCRSEVQPMDAPSRGKPVPPPDESPTPIVLGRSPLVSREEVRGWSCGQWRPFGEGKQDDHMDFDATMGYPGEGAPWLVRRPDDRPLRSSLVGRDTSVRYDRAWLQLSEWSVSYAGGFGAAAGWGDLTPKDFCDVLMLYVEFGYQHGLAHSSVVNSVLAAAQPTVSGGTAGLCSPSGACFANGGCVSRARCENPFPSCSCRPWLVSPSPGVRTVAATSASPCACGCVFMRIFVQLKPSELWQVTSPLGQTLDFPSFSR